MRWAPHFAFFAVQTVYCARSWMTSALGFHRKIAPTREAMFELACMGATIFALVAASDFAGWLTFWPAMLFSILGVAALAWCEPPTGAWNRLRPWMALVVAGLALSRCAADALTLTAIWLPL